MYWHSINLYSKRKITGIYTHNKLLHLTFFRCAPKLLVSQGVRLPYFGHHFFSTIWLALNNSLFKLVFYSINLLVP